MQSPGLVSSSGPHWSAYVHRTCCMLMPVWVLLVSVNLASAKVVPKDDVQTFTPSNKQQLAHKVEGKH